LQLNDDLALEPVTACTSSDTVAAVITNNQPATDAAARSYSAVVKSNKRPANFREAAVAAVYVDQRRKDSRKNSVIISGLPPRPQTDKSSVLQLFKTEFDLDTDIPVCRRLGQQLPGKIQPLLVVLKNPEHASLILSGAKRLRLSEDALVRKQIYINPHLTKAEATAAYDQRCQRRQRNQRLTSGGSIGGR
jgi:hypothetical protein